MANHDPLSVSQFLDLINKTVRELSYVVQGEITGWKTHPSGIYFSLKDKNLDTPSILDCYINPFVFRGMGITLQDGLEVKISGSAGIYKPKGRFSFRVETIALVGEGSLKQAYDLLRNKLEMEGLFDRKRTLPEFISEIGIITSRTGAVIEDFQKNLNRLGLRLRLHDVRVEGAKAVDQIIRATGWFMEHAPHLDVLVFMRGGGSLEDLQAFNNELVARALFASKIPTIAAIGHDRDVPIAALVADVAVSTPTAAAMLVNSTWDRLHDSLSQCGKDLAYGFETMFAAAVRQIDPDPMIRAFDHMLDSAVAKTESFKTYLHGVDPKRNLRLGYSVTTDQRGNVIKDISILTAGQRVRTRVANGSFTSAVETVDG